MKYYLRKDNWVVLEHDFPDEVVQDFRNDEELMFLMKTYKNIIYNIQAPLEWLHPEVSYVEVQHFEVDFENGEVIIIPESGIEYEPLEDDRLMWALNKFHKVIYMHYAPIDWLPDGIRVLMIKDNNFNHPLNNLPPSLESLTINASKYMYGLAVCAFNYPLDMLPHGLRHLCIRDVIDYSQNLNNLPPMLEYLEISYMAIRSKNANEIEDGIGVEDGEQNYRRLCSSIPNIFIADNYFHYTSVSKIQEFNEYQSKLPKDYKIHLIYV